MTLAASPTTEPSPTDARSVPAVNDHVVVRGRPWIVMEVVPKGLSAPELDEGAVGGATVVRLPSLTVVRLPSLNGDSMGGTASVVRGLEPGPNQA